MNYLIQFLAVSLFVFVADFVWLGVVMKNFYQHELGQIMRQNEQGFAPRIFPAVIVYILIPVGIMLFVGPKAPDKSLATAAIWGALFGLVVYGIYDLSNLAVLDKWTMRVTIADILWGTSLCSATAVCLKLVEKVTN